MPYTTRELFARLIQCEAGGEGDNGMRAVATVIMNRSTIQYGEFAHVNQGGNIRNIIEQYGQFNCMRDVLGGKPNRQNVWNMTPTELHYEIADWAMAGNILPGIDHSLFFHNPYSPKCPTYFPPGGAGIIHNRLNDHCVYIPPEKYADT